MFELYANRGPYGVALRSSYMRVEDENSRSGLIDSRVETGLDMGVSDLLAIAEKKYGKEVSQLEVGSQLKKHWQIQPPESCAACHR